MTIRVTGGLILSALIAFSCNQDNRKNDIENWEDEEKYDTIYKLAVLKPIEEYKRTLKDISEFDTLIQAYASTPCLIYENAVSGDRLVECNYENDADMISLFQQELKKIEKYQSLSVDEFVAYVESKTPVKIEDGNAESYIAMENTQLELYKKFIKSVIQKKPIYLLIREGQGNYHAPGNKFADAGIPKSAVGPAWDYGNYSGYYDKIFSFTFLFWNFNLNTNEMYPLKWDRREVKPLLSNIPDFKFAETKKDGNLDSENLKMNGFYEFYEFSLPRYILETFKPSNTAQSINYKYTIIDRESDRLGNYLSLSPSDLGYELFPNIYRSTTKKPTWFNGELFLNIYDKDVLCLFNNNKYFLKKGCTFGVQKGSYEIQDDVLVLKSPNFDRINYFITKDSTGSIETIDQDGNDNLSWIKLY